MSRSRPLLEVLAEKRSLDALAREMVMPLVRAAQQAQGWSDHATDHFVGPTLDADGNIKLLWVFHDDDHVEESAVDVASNEIDDPEELFVTVRLQNLNFCSGCGVRTDHLDGEDYCDGCRTDRRLSFFTDRDSSDRVAMLVPRALALIRGEKEAFPDYAAELAEGLDNDVLQVGPDKLQGLGQDVLADLLTSENREVRMKLGLIAPHVPPSEPAPKQSNRRIPRR